MKLPTADGFVVYDELKRKSAVHSSMISADGQGESIGCAVECHRWGNCEDAVVKPPEFAEGCKVTGSKPPKHS